MFYFSICTIDAFTIFHNSINFKIDILWNCIKLENKKSHYENDKETFFNNNNDKLQ